MFRRLRDLLERHVRYRVTRSGYLFLTALGLVGAAAIASANNLLFLILAAMIASLSISGFVSRLSLAGLELELILPEHISARQPVSVRLRLRNLKWGASFAIHLTGRAGAGPPIIAKSVIFPVIPGRAAAEVETSALFPKRGNHRENLFAIATRFPFGFVERRAWVSIASEVVIYPALEGSLSTEELLSDLRGDLDREQRGSGSDFYRLRPYTHNESARHVDWKSSAHTRELQVREFSREERSTVYLFLDLSPWSGSHTDDQAFERAVESCAFLVWMLSAESTRVRFRTQDTDLLFPDQVDVYQILRVLACVEPQSDVRIPASDEDEPDVLFSAAPQRFLENGWRPDRVVAFENP